MLAAADNNQHSVMKCDKNSLALLSSKRTKAYTRTRADEAFALPSFSDAMPMVMTEPPSRSVTVARPEHHPEHDVVKLKQTMLQHEFTFKEQLYELHRLYQVQQLLMEESKRKGPALHPHPDPPSSNSSLLYNPDSFRPRGDNSLGDANDGSKISVNQQLSLFPGQIDVNKPHEAVHHEEQIVKVTHQKDGRPTFDLERPAEEYIDVEVEEEKFLLRGMFLETTCTSNVSASHPSRVLGESRGLGICPGFDTEKVDSMIRETFGSNGKRFEENWGQDCLTPERPEHKEVPFFLLGPSRTTDCSFQEALLCPVQALSSASTLGGITGLNDDFTSAERLVPGVQRNLEEKMKERQLFDLDAGERSTEGTSKLPHWLLQVSSAASTKTVTVDPVAQTSGGQHQPFSFFLQNRDEVNQSRKLGLFPGERSNTKTIQEHSNPWSNSGTNLQQGQQFSRGSPSSGFFPSVTSGTSQGFHKMVQAGGVRNENFPLLSHVRDDKGAGLLPICASGYPSSPAVDMQTPVFEALAASTMFLPGLSSRGTTNASTMPPWYQQKGFSSLMQQESNLESLNEIPSYVSSVNPWPAAPNNDMRPAVSMRSASDLGGSVHGMPKADDNTRNLKSPLLSLVTRPEVTSKRPIFEFMTATSDLELTLGLSTKVDETLSTQERVKEPSFFGQVAHDRLNLMRKGFDLNVQRSQGPAEKNLDACCTAESRTDAIYKSFTQEHESFISPGWHVATGIKVPFLDDRKTLQTNFNLKVTVSVDGAGKELVSSEVATAKEVTQLQNSSIFSPKADVLGNLSCAEGFYGGSDTSGGPLVGGKSSDGSGLTSCESREAPPLAFAKARDESNTSSGEACQSRESRIPGQSEVAAFSSNVQSKKSAGMFFEEASTVVGSQQPKSVMLPTTFSSLAVFQHDTTKNCSIENCTDFNDDSEAWNNNARKHVIETAEAAEVLLSLGFSLPSVVMENYAASDRERSLKWLADIIPQEESCEMLCMDVDATGEAGREGTLGSSSGIAHKKMLDSFESAVLMLKPISPDAEKLTTQVIEKCDPAEECPPLRNLRRRSSRRGRVGKDFQREMLPSMASLSRQEITEDLQIIEGLIKSTTEAMVRCSLSSKEDGPSSKPEAGSVKNSAKASGTKSCSIGKHSGLCRVCSWGEVTRRKRMRRQRSQWLCLPPGV